MTFIVVDDEQAKVIAQAKDRVQIRDRSGNHLGFITHGFTQEDAAIAKARLATPGRRYSTEEVLDRLQGRPNRLRWIDSSRWSRS
jgi:hypothetical protein